MPLLDLCGAHTMMFLLAMPLVFAAPGSWDLVFADEFDTFNTSNWTPTNSSITSQYVGHDARFIPEMVSVSGGNLVITTALRPSVLDGVAYNMTSGYIDSQNKQQFDTNVPLRFEASMKMPNRYALNAWPAFWLLPANTCWPVSGEVDIIEWYGGDDGHFQHSKPGNPSAMSSTYHFGYECSNDKSSYNKDSRWYPNTTDFTAPIIDFTADFHTFGAELNATALRFYVDNSTSFVLDLPELCVSQPGFVWGSSPYRPFNPMYLIFNTAVRPNTNTAWWETNNATLLVDWVRVYELH